MFRVKVPAVGKRSYSHQPSGKDLAKVEPEIFDWLQIPSFALGTSRRGAHPSPLENTRTALRKSKFSHYILGGVVAQVSMLAFSSPSSL
mmetsp:Transcript_31808/g.44351  ORF Transcript_31808/g.44351 Transcript_31808/m.44351 type:complete len:89 (-) Transcript_31808:490-756(-)